MTFSFRWALRLGWLCSAPVVMCRVVTATLWISGGSDGVVYGGDQLPGWLGIMSHIQEHGPEDPWLEVGGTRDWAEFSKIENGRLPDAVVPSEFLLQRFGQDLFEESVPWVVSNIGILPQFPQKEVPVPDSHEWKHPDGFSIEMRGLLSEKAPLRIPPSQLRPLRVIDPVDALQKTWVTQPPPEQAFQVVVLPEQADVKAMSRQLPEALVLVEPAGGRPQVVELGGGARLRVRPGEFGRALIRVEVKWDTVKKTFLDPKAEVVWVREPNLESFTLPNPLVERVRPLPEEPADEEGIDSQITGPYRSVADAEFIQLGQTARFSDAVRLRRYGRDQVLLRIPLTSGELTELRKLDLPQLKPGSRQEFLVSADRAAGNGGDEWIALRRFLDQMPSRPMIVETLWEPRQP